MRTANAANGIGRAILFMVRMQDKQDIQSVLDEVQTRIGAPVRLKAVESA